MNVLSLFDGISCGQIALERAGIKVDNYFASEIDKHAIKVTQHNYLDTIQLGDVTKISIRSFYLSGDDFSVKGMNDTNLQDIIPEWEMLYWLDKEFLISATVGTQKPNEQQEIQSTSLQRLDQIRLSKRGVGSIIKTRDIEGCRASRDFGNKAKYTELQCGDWWYVYRSDPGDSEKDFGEFEGTGCDRGDEGEAEKIGHSTIPVRRDEGYFFAKNEGFNGGPRLESQIRRGKEEYKHEREVDSEEGDRSQKKSSPLSNFKRELQRRNEIDGSFESNENIIRFYPKIQVTMVKSENRVILFNGVFQIVFGGSPCQGFSFAGKQLNFEDSRSKLFFEYVRLLRECKPSFFLLENVKMKKESEKVISEYLGVEPIEINSALVSAQNRRRLYWTNIPNVEKPRDMNKSFQSFKEDGEHLKPFKLNKTPSRIRMWSDGLGKNSGGSCGNITNAEKVYCLTGKQDRCPNSGLIEHEDFCRFLSQRELEECQTVPVNYTDVISYNQACKVLGNGWTVDVIAHIFKNIPESIYD